jgi:SET domain-containing protein
MNKYLEFLKENINQKNYSIKKSKINGYGVFSNNKFKKYEFINEHGRMIEKKFNITEFGSYLNHSNNPNAETKIEDNIYKTYALKEINPNDEITLDYTNRKELEQPKKDWK